MMREEQRTKSHHVRGRHGAAVPSRIAAAGNARYHRDSRRAHAHRRPPTTEVRRVDTGNSDQLRQRSLSVTSVLRIFPELPHRRYREHARYIAWKLHRPTAIPGAGNAGDAIQTRLGDFLGHELREIFAADADMHDIETPFDALVQRIDEVAEVAAGHHLEYVNLRGRCTADDARRGSGGRRDDAGAMR